MNHVRIHEKLAAHVPPERLADNAGRMMEKFSGLSSTEQSQALAIEGVLTTLPLTHATRSQPESVRQRGLLPNKDVRKNLAIRAQSHTRRLDKSLGLDHYVFMRPAEYTRHTMYGNNYVSIDGSLLHDPATIVSPRDITHTVQNTHLSYDKLEPTDKANAEKYFDSLVTGRDWVKITSRKVLRHLIDTDCRPVPVTDIQAEVKHFGPITPEAIRDITDLSKPQNESAKHDEVLSYGFVATSVAALLESSACPPAIAERAEAAKRHWETVLASV